jgi:transposase
MGNDTAIAVDVAKNVFELGISERPGVVRRKERLQRSQFLPFLAAQPPATVVMEACGSAQFWARRIEQLGHRVVLLPAHLVRPYVRGNKTDRTDVKGILEAYRNEDIRPVPIKTPARQTLVALHRLRGAWLTERTARLNTIRGLLRELGVFIPVGARKVVPEVWMQLSDADSGIPDAVRPFLAEACEEVRDIERRVALVERQLEALAEQTPTIQRLLSVAGIGLLTATALFALVGRAAISFRSSSRELPGAHAAGAIERKHETARSDHQARRRVFAHSPRPRGAVGARARQAEGRWAATRSPTRMGGQSGEGPRPQQSRGGPRKQDGSDGVGGLASRSRLPADTCRRLTPTTNSHPGLPRDRVMAEQVGPAHGKPITTMALEAGVQRLASVRADSVMARSSQSSNLRGRRYVCSPSRSARLSIVSTRLDHNVFPRNVRPPAVHHQWRPPGGALRQGLRPCTPTMN